MQNRTLFFGDNLEILRKKIPDEIFDLIYLDPPFNSNRNYNVLFKEGAQDSQAQVHAFEDSWHWTNESKHTFDYLVTKTNDNISNLMQALEKMIGHNDMLAYLTMMTVRLIELHRVLKKTGSLYLHCDPTASHYLKIVLDVVFGKNNFQKEIIWSLETVSGYKSQANNWIRGHDIIIFYSKSDNYYFNKQFLPHKEEYIARFKKIEGDGRRYRDDRSGGRKQYLDETPGRMVSDVWNDIMSFQQAATSSEILGYPTQKPVSLLERIIKASSKDGDWVLDPFCGCGTTVVAAEKLKRNWVGIDITTLAINLIKRRLRDQFGLGVKQIITDGLPTDLAGAKEMFVKDAFQFEYWALDLINAMPAQGKSKENMRGADKGIDGVIKFIKDIKGKDEYEYGKAVVQVKGGGVQRNQIATLISDMQREKADAGIFITLEKPTKPMVSEAFEAGTFTTRLTNKIEFPKIQILTVEELLRGVIPKLPQAMVKDYHKKAKAVEVEDNKFQAGLGV